MRIVSYSQLKMAARCPFKWHLNYGLGWVSPESAAREPLRIGKFMHEALAAAYAWGQVPVRWPDQTDVAYSEEVQELIRLQKACNESIAHDLESEMVLATEWPLRVRVPTLSGNPSHCIFIGWIDMITRNMNTGAVTIWDHKTTKRMSKNDLFYDYQLGLYAWALATMGFTPNRVVLNIIRRKRVAEVTRFEANVLPGAIGSWGRQLYAMYRGLPKESDHLVKAVSPTCSWDCDYRDVCRMDANGESVAARALLEETFEPRNDEDRPLSGYNKDVPAAWMEM